MIEHVVEMPDGTQMLVLTDNHMAYPSRLLTHDEALWVNKELAIMGVPQRLNSVWNKLNGS